MLNMPDTPLVSIIMNCYNGERYLSEAINSVYSQTYKNWEIILWDNASTDNTAEIAQSYDKKLKYFRSQETTVLGEARVCAVEKSRGQYLAFLDCDDFWEVDKLEEQISLFDNNKDIGMVYGRTRIINHNSKDYIDMKGVILPTGNVFNLLAKKEAFIIFSSIIIDKTAYKKIGGFDKALAGSMDYALYLGISNNYLIDAVQDVCCNYRVHSNNLSHKISIVIAQESVDILKAYLPDTRAYYGLKYLYAALVVANIKERKYMHALALMLRYRVAFRVLKRLYNYLFSKHS
jgi:glycosyltransferase involved in cell wall biosynthesis